MLKNSKMANNLTSKNAEDILISGSAPQITSTNTAGIQTKEMNLSLKVFVVFFSPRNIILVPVTNVKSHTEVFHNQLDD